MMNDNHHSPFIFFMYSFNNLLFFTLFEITNTTIVVMIAIAIVNDKPINNILIIDINTTPFSIM